MIENELKSLLSEVAKKVNSRPKNAPSQRKLFKERYSFSNESTDEQLKIWDYIWNNSSDFWIKIQAFLFCESQIKNKDFLIYSWNTIKYWQTQVDNWKHCDGLSKINTKILELSPSKVLKQLKVWNKSNNQWNKRQSLVSLLYFSRTKKIFLDFNTIISLVDNLVNDKEYYVQKAIGWSLKELYSAYPNETMNYLEKNNKTVSTISFSPATEKLQKHEKEKLKKIRQDSRV